MRRIKMLAKTLKWGNSLALRIPKPLARECGIEEHTHVDIRVEKHELIIMPVRKKYSLEELLAGVTEENIHDEVSDGRPVGKELL
jgi:antitoxin MazE